jgi:hypothetical protein
MKKSYRCDYGYVVKMKEKLGLNGQLNTMSLKELHNRELVHYNCARKPKEYISSCIETEKPRYQIRMIARDIEAGKTTEEAIFLATMFG